MRRLRPLLILILAGVGAPAPVAAQAPRWEIEGYGGVLAGQAASAGRLTTPAAGAPLVTSTPTFPARATSSWLFGDGADLLNGVLAEFSRSGRIASLDATFAPLPAARVPGFGARLRRRLNPRVSFEVGIDVPAGAPVDTGRIAAAIDAARASFAPAFADLFASGPFSRVTAAAQVVMDEGRYRETAVTAAFNRDAGRLAALTPYFTVGAGVIASRGTLPSALITGHYAASILGEVPIDETDRVALRFSRSVTFAAVLGGGLHRDLSARWGVRIDARVLVGPDPTRVRLDATPTFVRGTPAGFIESFTNPAIQFSNDPATGRRSSLSGAPLHDVEVFHGGVLARSLVTAAVSRRF